MNTPALITNRMIWDELQRMNSKIDDLYQRDFSNSNGIISMHKLCKRWGKGREFIKQEVKAGRLNAKVKTKTRRVDGELMLYEYFEFSLQEVLEYERSFGDEDAEDNTVFIEPFENTVKNIINKYKDKRN